MAAFIRFIVVTTLLAAPLAHARDDAAADTEPAAKSESTSASDSASDSESASDSASDLDSASDSASDSDSTSDSESDSASDSESASDSDSDSLPSPDPAPQTAAEPELDPAAVDGHGCFGFAGRVVGIPAMLVGGTLLLTGLHALTVSETLTATGIGAGGYWTNFGGLIAMGIGALALVIGELALTTGAIGDLLTALDLTFAGAKGAGVAWGRIFAWEGAGHLGALGAGLTVGGVLTFVTAIVLPSIFLFSADQQSAYGSLATLGVLTGVSGIAAVVLAAVLGGVSLWLDGAVTSAYKKAAGATVEARRRRTTPRRERSLAMAY